MGVGAGSLKILTGVLVHRVTRPVAVFRGTLCVDSTDLSQTCSPRSSELRNKSMFIFASLSNSYATALASCASVLAIKVGALNLLTVRRYICVILELHMLAFDLLKLLRPAWRTL